jgi:hypothetical protein
MTSCLMKEDIRPIHRMQEHRKADCLAEMKNTSSWPRPRANDSCVLHFNSVLNLCLIVQEDFQYSRAWLPVEWF